MRVTPPRAGRIATITVILIVVTAVIGPVGTVVAQPSISTSQTTQSGETTVAPGETITVEATIDYDELNSPGLDVTLPPGWTVQSHTDDGGTYGPPQPAWVWLEGDDDGVAGSHTVTYTVLVPSNASDGTYILTAEGSGIDPADGSMISETDELAITVQSAPTNQPPVADAGSDQTVAPDASVSLDAQSSTDPDGDTLSYDWTVTDDGGTGVTLADANTATPSFTAPDVSDETTLTFEVTVDDGNGGTDTDTVTVTVQPSPSPVLYRVNAGGPELPAGDGPAWESDTAGSPSQHLVVDGSVGLTDWESFSDEPLSYSVGSAVPESTPDAIFEYERYATDGELEWAFPVTQGDTYEVRLYLIEQYEPADGPADRVLDVTAEGQTLLEDYDTSNEVGFQNATMESGVVTAADDTLELSISETTDGNSPNVFGLEIIEGVDEPVNQAPTASFTASATEVEVDQSVEFDASASSDPDGSIASYSWDFDGDGTEDASGAQVNHTFDSAGTYQVDLTVTDDDGATDTAQQSITVNPAPSADPSVTFTHSAVSPTTVSPGDSVTAEATIEYSDANGPAIDVTPPAGWTVTSHQDDGGTYGPPEPAWVWVEGDDDGVSGSHTVTYTLAVPDNASPGAYTIAGQGSAIDPTDDSVVTDTAAVTITVEAPAIDPIADFPNAPTDPDGDGLFEDVNGDGEVNVGDAQAIFAHTDDPVVQGNLDAFDFNGDGEVNVGDAQALFANGVEV